MSDSGNTGPSRSKSMPAVPGVEAVVLGAGRGVRLGALTESTPKVLLQVGHRPLLDYHLEALRSVGVRRVWMVVSYLAEQIEKHVDGGRRFGLDVTYVRQTEPLGTGDAVRAASSHIRSDSFLVCYGDVFVPSEASLLPTLLSDATPKIAAAWVPNGGSYGRLVTKEMAGELWLAGISEKDGLPGPALVNAGIYLLPKTLLTLVAELPRSPRGEYELTDALRSYVVQGGKIRVVPVEPWVDIGTEANLALANELASRAQTQKGA
jgi:UDP-N-acetylglucosamine diphosphorylase / glucose-1-phosphate thymidylyltransferase / UDP-N-acetylgalactosamine diphosphorylase / glucosamine-1-phosphate N-acetyltransferase / galactosamine-1-phosphate N-acetyltransferase